MNSKIEFFLINLIILLIGFLITYKINFKKNKKESSLQELLLFVKNNCLAIFLSIRPI